MLNFRIVNMPLTIIGLISLLWSGNYALAQTFCTLEIVKIAPGGGDQIFEFASGPIGAGENDLSFNFISDGENFFIPFAGNGTSVRDEQVTETPARGWVLSDVDCAGVGMEVTNIENGIEVECVEDGGAGTCRFTNSQVVSEIPTLSEWGLIAMAGILGIAALMVIRRRRVTA